MRKIIVVVLVFVSISCYSQVKGGVDTSYRYDPKKQLVVYDLAKNEGVLVFDNEYEYEIYDKRGKIVLKSEGQPSKIINFPYKKLYGQFWVHTRKRIYKVVSYK